MTTAAHPAETTAANTFTEFFLATENLRAEAMHMERIRTAIHALETIYSANTYAERMKLHAEFEARNKIYCEAQVRFGKADQAYLDERRARLQVG